MIALSTIQDNPLTIVRGAQAAAIVSTRGLWHLIESYLIDFADEAELRIFIAACADCRDYDAVLDLPPVYPARLLLYINSRMEADQDLKAAWMPCVGLQSDRAPSEEMLAQISSRAAEILYLLVS